MIKATGQDGEGNPLLILGVTRENVTRMIAGKPIRVTAAEMVTMGLAPVELIIHYGPTEKAIMQELRRLGPDAPLTDLSGGTVDVE